MSAGSAPRTAPVVTTLLLPLLWLTAAAAQDAPEATPAGPPPEEPQASVAVDPCSGDPDVDSPALDAMRSGVQRSVCRTARFVDRLFGGDHEYAETEDENNGRAGLALDWKEDGGFDLDGRFRASLALPALDERLNATIGRATPDEYIADELKSFDSVGGSFSDDQEAEWFAGLGYGLRRNRDSRFDLGAGVKLASPLNPYLNARYRKYYYPRERTLLTLRTTGFWENQEGLGLTQAFDVDQVLSDDHLLRWANSVRVSQETAGVRWRTRLALYQSLARGRFMRYELSARGETDATQPDLYGARVTFRRPLWRNWFFIEAGGTVYWADGPRAADRCDACLGATLGFELLFGDAYDRALLRVHENGGDPDGSPP